MFEELAQPVSHLALGRVAATCGKKGWSPLRSLVTRLADLHVPLPARPSFVLFESARYWWADQNRLLERLLQSKDRSPTALAVSRGRRRRLQRAALCGGLFFGLGWLELDRSWVEAQVVARLDDHLGFQIAPGPSDSIRFPKFGPYDKRLGYTQIPSMIERLSERNFTIEQQARVSPPMRVFVDLGGYAVFHEKSESGLLLRDASGQVLGGTSYPNRVFRDFNEIPEILVRTLQYLEDREVLDSTHPNRNPAIDWGRFAVAAAGELGGFIDSDWRQGGASTLATQLEKFRHSPDGRTSGVREKFRQMATATVRAYLDGPDTRSVQEQILTSYLNSTPLGSRLGFGEVIGLGEGLFAWYGVDWTDAAHYLSLRELSATDARRRALLYKQALSLLIAQRRPSFYLNAPRENLERRTNAYLRSLAAAGVIDRHLRDQALGLRLQFVPKVPAAPEPSFVEHKATDAVRRELLAKLDVPSQYTLDRFDISADVTIDAAAQRQVAAVLEKLKSPAAVAALGLVGDHMLGSVDPAKVAWSFVLCERGQDRNRVRIHIDSLDQPFDVNSGAKLMLGSTAKLRTLATYLGIIEALHGQLADLSSPTLRQVASEGDDPLRRWVAAYLTDVDPTQRSVRRTLDAAMRRRYSANPGEAFFTGGGVHVFHNFESWEDGEDPTVEEAFEHSINLAFIRLLHDVIAHYESEIRTEQSAAGSSEDQIRAKFLGRFADQEGRVYLRRFDADYFGLSADGALDRLASRAKPAPRALAAVFRSVRPDASVGSMQQFLTRRLAGSAYPSNVDELYTRYAPGKLTLADRAFVAGVHPLELWLVGYRQDNLIAPLTQVIAASTDARQQAYAWLLRSKDHRVQNIRIQTILEQDAFDKLLVDWTRQGYPFNHLVPSLATAIGSSGERADALANLMGIVVNNGVWQPTTDLEGIYLAPATPFATQMTYRPSAPQRVLSTDVAGALRRALAGVVAQGTGRGLRAVFVAPDGGPLEVGGKTGTGDNRFETFGSGHQLVESRPVDRTATFVFFLGDRFYGTLTAYVAGAQADQYRFSSALAVSLLKALAPELQPLLSAQRGA